MPSLELSQKIAMLQGKETSAMYKNLQELEALSETTDELYSFLPLFFDMLSSDKYAVRVRGARLICKQAKWDSENIINENIAKLLIMLSDEKPTAVGQVLQFLGHSLLPYKKELKDEVKKALLQMDFAKFKADTMRSLLKKESEKLLKIIEKL